MSDRDYDVGSKIRAYRKSRNLSLIGLSRRTGIAASNLSSIELNKSSPTLGTIIKIADAFGLKAGPFLDEVLYQKAVVHRESDSPPSEAARTPGKALLLTQGVMLNRMDAKILTLTPADNGIPVEDQGTDRFLYCLEGSFTASVDREHYHLNKGDSIYLLPETLANLTVDDSCARILMVNTPGKKCPRL